MSNQFAPYQQQPPPFYQEPPRASGSGCWWGAAIGCLGVAVVCVLLCAGGVWYVQHNAGRWVAGVVREVIVATINSSQIPAQEKTEVVAQVDRVVDAYKAGNISEQDLERMMKEFEKSPAFLMIMAWGLETTYVDPSDLADEEKEAARRTIQRAFRGLCEQKITQDQFTRVVPQQHVEDDNRGRPQMTDDEVRKMLADLKKLADDASIPDEPFEIDIGDEVKKAVDRALANQGEP